ncbi:hypothetical protein D3C72_1133830 [compost metagenome]
MTPQQWAWWANRDEFAEPRRLVAALGFTIEPVGKQRVTAVISYRGRCIRKHTTIADLATWAGGLRDAILVAGDKLGTPAPITPDP